MPLFMFGMKGKGMIHLEIKYYITLGISYIIHTFCSEFYLPVKYRFGNFCYNDVNNHDQ
jgi:hypothetical protein